ncbi:carbohydrate ABC transporter permease [Salinarimonas soli]|uniref:Sugar ABC transporter permease n=1 Tax=Salinarimonas soli TaxID=1638099 RepID=A0A5B2VDL8_9HYPH|nr:sugar ABC transporter permease [Salinarimonas soli]KAA2236776.1 sugar ABC transporter permease [Salinarimonas soli]
MRRRLVSGRVAAALALAPAALLLGVAFYGFLGWTAAISLTSSRLLPRADFVGAANYAAVMGDRRFVESFGNLLVFGVALVATAALAGLALAVVLDWLDRRGRRTGLAETVFLYPVAVSWLVTGLVWQWILNPSLGLERSVRAWGIETFAFDHLVRPGTALYALALAGAWHVAGMALAVFSAGLRGVDPDLWRAARVEGVGAHRVYLHVVLPMLGPHAMTVLLLLAFGVARAFDLVVAMTGGGPGYATDMPALYVYDHMFARGHLAVGAAAAVVLTLAAAAIVVPYLSLALTRRRPA